MLCRNTHSSRYLLPHFGSHICRDIHRSPVTDYDNRLRACLGHAHELILQGKLYLQRSLLSLAEKSCVLSKIVHTSLSEHGWHLGDSKHLVAKTWEMLNYLDQCGSLTSAWSASKHDFLYVAHILISFQLIVQIYIFYLNNASNEREKKYAVFKTCSLI